MIIPNLPKNRINTAIVSSYITKKIENELNNLGIKPLKLTGMMNCDDNIKHHPDLYLIHCSEDYLICAKNICSIEGNINFEINDVPGVKSARNIKYPEDVFFNSVFLGKCVIGCKKYMHPEILKFAEENNYTIINVRQGYAKCNICVVDEKSVITEDVGIANVLSDYGFDVLCLKNKVVRLGKYPYGFIGGASGKVSEDILAFYGDITKHPEYDLIDKFLKEREITPFSLSDEPLTDYGSLIPLF